MKKSEKDQPNIDHEPYRSARALIDDLRRTSTDGPAEIRGLLFVRGKLGGLHLDGGELARYRALAKLVGTEGAKRGHLSSSQTEGFFQDAILEALDVREARRDIDDDERTTAALVKLAGRLSAEPSTHRIYIAVEGITEDSLPHAFGEVTFVTGREARREILRPLGGGERAGTEAERLRERYPGTTACTEVLSGDHVDAGERGRRRIAEVLDVLNFYADVLEPPLGRPWVAVRGQRHQTWCGASVSDESSNVHFSDRWFPITLPRSTSDRAKELGYWRVSELLASGTRSRLEQRLVTALRHAGRASVAVEPERAVLGYMIALETALIGKNGGGGKLALRTAHVIARKVENRRKIVKRVQDLYEKRSRIVHAGDLEASSDDVAHARHYAKESILRLIFDEPYRAMKTIDELEEFFNDCVLGGAS